MAAFSITDISDTLVAIWFNEFEEAKVSSVEVTGSVTSILAKYAFDEVLVGQPDGSYEAATPATAMSVCQAASTA